MEQITTKLGEYKSNLSQAKENQKKLLGIEKVIISSIEKLQKSIQGASLQLSQQESEIKLYSENQQSIEGELDPLKQKLEERHIARETKTRDGTPRAKS